MIAFGTPAPLTMAYLSSCADEDSLSPRSLYSEDSMDSTSCSAGANTLETGREQANCNFSMSTEVPSIKIDGPGDSGDECTDGTNNNNKLSSSAAEARLTISKPRDGGVSPGGSSSTHPGYKKLMRERYIRSEDRGMAWRPEGEAGPGGARQRLMLEQTRSRSLDRTYTLQDQPLDLSRARSHSSRQIFARRANAKHSRVGAVMSGAAASDAAHSTEDIPKHTRVTEMDRYNPLQSSPERPLSRQASGSGGSARQSSCESSANLSVDHGHHGRSSADRERFARSRGSSGRSSALSGSLDRERCPSGHSAAGSVDRDPRYTTGSLDLGSSVDKSSFDQSSFEYSSLDYSQDMSSFDRSSFDRSSFDRSLDKGGGYSSGGSVSGSSFERLGSGFDLASEGSGITIIPESSPDGLLKPGLSPRARGAAGSPVSPERRASPVVFRPSQLSASPQQRPQQQASPCGPALPPIFSLWARPDASPSAVDPIAAAAAAGVLGDPSAVAAAAASANATMSPYYSPFLRSPPMPSPVGSAGSPVGSAKESGLSDAAATAASVQAHLEAIVGQSRASGGGAATMLTSMAGGSANSGTHVCPVSTCGLTFTSFDTFAKHIAKHLPTSTVAHPSGKLHFCQMCGRSFSRSDMLTRHVRLHTGIKPYECTHCGQVFSRSDHLNTHQRTHTGEKPYKCQHCPYAASRRDMITRHRRIHARVGVGAASAGDPSGYHHSSGRGRHRKRLGDTRSVRSGGANPANSSVESTDSFMSSMSSMDSSFEAGDPHSRSTGVWSVRQILDHPGGSTTSPGATTSSLSPLSSSGEPSVASLSSAPAVVTARGAHELSSSSGGSTSASMESGSDTHSHHFSARAAAAFSASPASSTTTRHGRQPAWSSLTSTESVDANENPRGGDREGSSVVTMDSSLAPEGLETSAAGSIATAGSSSATPCAEPHQPSTKGQSSEVSPSHSAVSRRKSFVRQDASLEEDVDEGRHFLTSGSESTTMEACEESELPPKLPFSSSSGSLRGSRISEVVDSPMSSSVDQSPHPVLGDLRGSSMSPEPSATAGGRKTLSDPTAKVQAQPSLSDELNMQQCRVDE